MFKESGNCMKTPRETISHSNKQNVCFFKLSKLYFNFFFLKFQESQNNIFNTRSRISPVSLQIYTHRPKSNNKKFILASRLGKPKK
jgi:hypothetical protein